MASKNGLSSAVPFQVDGFRFPRSDGDRSEPVKPPSSAEIVAFSGDRVGRFCNDHRSSEGWGLARDGSSSSGDGSDGEDDYEDVDEGIGFASVNDIHNKKGKENSCGGGKICSDKDHEEERSSSLNSALVLSGMVIARGVDENGGNLGENSDNGVTVAQSAHYHSFIVHGEDGTPLRLQKEVGKENGCGFSGRRDGGLVSGYWETLRSHLSDPITAVLMEDAMILSCGHTFGSGGMQHVYKMKSCYTCSHPLMEDSVRPNLSLRAAVQAFHREEETYLFRASKRRKEKLEQCIYHDSSSMDNSRGYSGMFPFAVSDRVLIKGNKRTPPRFVGRAAVVTTQCLNGWYVVKTLDNAESVKLQYRSLEKIADDRVPNLVSNKALMPNWL